MTVIALNENDRPHHYEIDDETPPPNGVQTVDGEYLVTYDFIRKYSKVFASQQAVILAMGGEMSIA